MPAPPVQSAPLAVYDLSYKIHDDRLILTWPMPTSEAKIVSNISGFIVYRSRTAMDKSECRNCPLIFEPVADMPVAIKDLATIKTKKMTYYETLRKGCRYTYKVSVYPPDKRVSRYSNQISFGY